jgi:hypothetical protein
MREVAGQRRDRGDLVDEPGHPTRRPGRNVALLDHRRDRIQHIGRQHPTVLVKIA